MSVEQFEKIILSQKPIPPAHYDQEYFHSDWRAESNNYSIETRRKVEAKNPALIRDTFEAKSVLDFGCGPGALMYFLWELGVDVEGIDFSEYARRSAPREVRDRIHVLGVDDPMPRKQYDLVVCREVMEHLTVLQIQKAVENICKLSSRYVYVTTRYSKQKENFLAVDVEPEVDASHISLLNKDLLRMLFVLQGFRSRPDLEGKMDWKGYGRVIVMERTPLAKARAAA